MPWTRDSVEEFLEQHAIHTVRVGWCDLHGLMRGKALSRERFLEALERGVAQSTAPLLMDLRGDVDDRASRAGKAGWPDMWAIPALDSLRHLPHDPGAAELVADLVDEDGQPVQASPRYVLRRVMQRALELGWHFTIGAELEFYIFRDEECATLPPGRQALRVHLGRDERRCIERLWRDLAAMGFLTEALYAEDGPGQFEINLAADEPLATCDMAFIFRRTVKQIVAREGLVATFMAKPLADASGSGFHLHQTASIGDSGDAASKARKPAFTLDGDRASKACCQFAAGQLAFAVEAAALYLPTVNAYKRIKLRGSCPLSLCWAWDNRSCALRLIRDRGGEVRLENRIPGADANPYLITAAAIATGLAGVEQQLTPPEPATESTYLGRQGGEALPCSLAEAVAALDQSSLLRDWLGDDFVDAFVAMKSHEADRFASSITDWERAEYLPYL